MSIILIYLSIFKIISSGNPNQYYAEDLQPSHYIRDAKMHSNTRAYKPSVYLSVFQHSLSINRSTVTPQMKPMT